MIDMHVHFFPPAVFRAIWRFFENESAGLWPIRYKVFGKELVETLRSLGVERFPTLVYAHKAQMADALNDFVSQSAGQYPEILPFGTIFAADKDNSSRARSLFEERNFYGIKLHPFVSNEELDDPRFFPIYEMMEAMQRILVCHPGSGPNYHQNDGADRIGSILTRFPSLPIIIAHCGAIEYSNYAALADRYSNVYFDTAMNCVHTHVFANNCPGRGFFERFADRVLLGTDFPNIPYDYQQQLDAIKAFGLGPQAESAIFGGNAAALLQRAESSMRH